MSKKKHEWTRKGVTASMAVVLAFGMVPAVPTVALASNEDAATIQDSIVGTATITLCDADGTQVEFAGDTLAEAVEAAQDGYTIHLGAGAVALDDQESTVLTIENKAVNIIGVKGETSIDGAIVYKFAKSSSEETKRVVAVDNLIFNIGDVVKGTGLTFRGDEPNEGYNIEASVAGCKFNGGAFGVGVFSHANGYEVSVDSCEFNTWCGIAFNYDNETDGQIADNKLNITNSNSVNGAYAVQKFNNATGESFANVYYPTASDFTSDKNGVIGSEVVNGYCVSTYAELTAALEAAQSDSVIKLTNDITLNGALDGTKISEKTLTIDGNGNAINFNQANTGNAVFGSNINPLYAGTNLTVKNLTINNTGETQGGYASVIGYNAAGAKISYERCVFENLYSPVYVNPFNSVPTAAVELSISSCKYDGTQYGYAIDEESNGQYQWCKVNFADNNSGYAVEKNSLKNVAIVRPAEGEWFQMFSDGSYPYEDTTGVLEAAVNAAETGERIELTPGTYGITDSLSISKDLSIMGSGDAALNLTDEANILLAGDDTDLTLKGLDITGSVNPIIRFGNDASSNNQTVTIENCTIAGAPGSTNIHGVSLGTGGTHNTLNVKNTVFENMKCALGIADQKDGEHKLNNKVNLQDVTFRNIETPYQLFYNNDGSATNTYFETLEAMRDKLGKDRIDGVFTVTTTPAPAPTPTPDEGETVTNPDGSTTTTVEGEGGSTVETTVSKDEAVTTVVEKDASGKVTKVEAEVSQAAVDAAAGAPVALPMAEPVEPASAADAPAISVSAPGKARIALPVANAEGSKAPAPGAVLAVVDSEGNVTPLPKTGSSDGALAAEVPGDCTLKVVDASVDFPDVSEGDWFASAADFASARGILAGTVDASGAVVFDPAGTVTRGMFVAMLNRVESRPSASEGFEGFGDVAEGSWSAQAADWGAEEGLVLGTSEDTFDGNLPVTREQMALFMMRYAEWLGMDVSARSDAETGASEWAAEAMSWAVAEGLIVGDGQGYNAQGGATRAEAATVVQRFINMLY